MDKIWDRKSFEVRGHWPLWLGWKKRMTTQNHQKNQKIYPLPHIYAMGNIIDTL